MLGVALLFPLAGRGLAQADYTFTTFAGLASTDGTNGTGAAARFYKPQGVATDAAGNVYVADTDNHVIRKISPAGEVTTLAGLVGQAGNANGLGTAARFWLPTDVAVDGSGVVYVSESSSQTIRKITPQGLVTAFVGNSQTAPGSTDGTGSAARFYLPTGLATDIAGNVYVAEYGNNTIRKITPAGEVTTLAGTAGQSGLVDGTGAAARFTYPHDLTVDGAGNVYVADYGNFAIRKVTPNGVVTTLAGTGFPGSEDGTGSAAGFLSPRGIALYGADLLVADTSNSVLRKVTLGGVVTTMAGVAGRIGSDDGSGVAVRFNQPYALAGDSAGNVYVADTENQLIRKISAAGAVTTLAGQPPYGSADGLGATARFYEPSAVAVDEAGNTYVADAKNHTIRKITTQGLVSTLAGYAGLSGLTDGVGTAARFNTPSGVAVDASGNVYVADTANSCVRKISPSGSVSTLATGTLGVTGVAVDGAGTVYVAETSGYRVLKISPTGVVSTLAGSGVSGAADGLGVAAAFAFPTGVAVDGDGVVYVADALNRTVRKITAAGLVSTFAGSTGVASSVDGVGAAARFVYPYGVGVDGAGNVYVADAFPHEIRKITRGAADSTIGGITSTPGFADGVGTLATFNRPRGVAVDGAGNLYVADALNNTIRKGTRPVAVTISSQPLNQVIPLNSTTVLTVVGSATGSLAYQWRKNGFNLAGATSHSLTLSNASLADGGTYSVVLFTDAGLATSVKVTLNFVGTVALGGLRVTYDGGPHAVTVGTTPASLAVTTTYDGSTAVPTQAGSYAVVATVTEPLFQGTASGVLVIEKATSVLTWPLPTAISYGVPLSVVQLNATSPVPGTWVYTPGIGTVLGAGSHLLTANFTPTDAANYTSATASNYLIVNKANQTITFGALPTRRFGDSPFNLMATAVPSGLPVAFSAVGGPAVVSGATVSLFAAGTVTVRASQTGNDNYNPAASIDRSFAVARMVNPIPGTRADFNGDGKPDLIWSNAITGERAIWLMANTSFLGNSTLGLFPVEWTIAATGDFNGDGDQDLVWSNSVTGERAIWLMNGTALLGTSTLGVFPLEWTVAATADFNSDGKPDIIWSNSATGERAIWLMNGTSFLGASTLGVFPLEWTVAATGDFNADGKPDIIWSNSVTGERAIWLMNETNFLAASTLGIFPLEWTVAGTADFNADGKPDIIWSNSMTGERALWLMNGTTFLGASSLGIFPLEWTVSN